VQLPATDHAELDEEFDQYAHEPEEAVVFSYDELSGNLDGWVDKWAREIAGN
jgi:thiamine transport system substrate-binding protein